MQIGCIFVSDYPAWALLRHDAGAPLAVVAQGRVRAAGPEARARGVEEGMRVGRALSLCQDITLRPRDRALESAMWGRVEHTLNSTTPYVERACLGRSFIHPHDDEQLKRVVQKIGAQAGCAPTRIDAHLAARKAAAGRILKIAKEYQEAFRRDVPVERLVPVGVEEKVVERLELFGYETVAEVATLSKRHLEAQFGDAGGQLFDRLHAIDESSVSVYTPPPTIEVVHRFERPQRKFGTIKEAVDALIAESISELEGRTTQRLSLRLEAREKGALVTSRILREAQSAEHALKSTAHTLLKERLSAEMEIEEVVVVLGALGDPDGRQGHLFFKRPAVRTAVEAVHRRHPGILRRSVFDPDAVFPEERLRYEPVREGSSGSPPPDTQIG